MAVQTDPKKRLIAHMQDAHALEQSVLRLLESVLSTSQDEELQNLATAHKAETEKHEGLLRERLQALGSSPKRVKQVPAMLSSKIKGAGDRVRTDKAVKNARDWFTVENLEIASYELLERLAQRGGDDETASAAEQILADERRTADRLAGSWSRVVDASIETQESTSKKREKLKEQMSRVVSAAKEKPASLALGSIAAGALVGSRMQTKQAGHQPGEKDEVATSAVNASTHLTEPAAIPEPITGPPPTGVAPSPTAPATGAPATGAPATGAPHTGAMDTLDEPLSPLTPVDLAQMTKPELIELARAKGVVVHGKMTKAELIATLDKMTEAERIATLERG